jgi:hypothetical protein
MEKLQFNHKLRKVVIILEEKDEKTCQTIDTGTVVSSKIWHKNSNISPTKYDSKVYIEATDLATFLACDPEIVETHTNTNDNGFPNKSFALKIRGLDVPLLCYRISGDYPEEQFYEVSGSTTRQILEWLDSKVRNLAAIADQLDYTIPNQLSDDIEFENYS